MVPFTDFGFVHLQSNVFGTDKFLFFWPTDEYDFEVSSNQNKKVPKKKEKKEKSKSLCIKRLIDKIRSGLLIIFLGGINLITTTAYNNVQLKWVFYLFTRSAKEARLRACL